MKPTVLILSNSPLDRDPRVQRQISALRDEYDISTAGLTGPNCEGVQFTPIERSPMRIWTRSLLRACLFGPMPEYYYWNLPWIRKLRRALRKISFDIVLANDYDMLPLAIQVAASRPVVFDAHEYALDEIEPTDPTAKRMMVVRDRLVRNFVPKASSMMTVCDGIAELYEQETGVLPETVMNLPDFVDLQPTPTNPGKIRLIHHGGANPARRLELMIEMMDHLDDRYHLTFMLINAGPPNHLERFQAAAADNPKVDFLDPVPMHEIANKINSYDIGVFLLPPELTNYRLALPNKLFEFIQARLAVAIGPSPEMARVVSGESIGVVSNEFDPKSLADAIASLSIEQLQNYKKRSHEIAKTYSSERVHKQVQDIVRKTLAEAR